MNILLLSVKNLRRKKIRSVLTIGGVAIAVGVLISLLGFDSGYQKSLTDNIDKMGYQLLVTAKGCPYEAATMMLKGGGGLRYMEQKVYDDIKNDSRVDKISPQLVASVFDPELQKGQGGYALYMGVNDDYLKLKPWAKFKSGGWFSGEDVNEVIIGFEAAEFEQRSVGDEVFVPGIGQILKVVGIFERTGTQDDGMMFIPLKTAQRIFTLPGKLTGIGIKLKDIHQISKFEEDMYKVPETQVISMAQVRGTILNLISSAKVLADAVALIAIFIAVIGVMNTILMSVFERTQEIGISKALGASRLDVFRLIWTETIVICVIGGAIGCGLALAGSGLVEYVIKKILPYAPTGKLVTIEPKLLAFAIIGAVVLGIISGIYPAWRASSMKPVQAIRSVE
ncbi:MAG: ABC transporter permease [Phycisphaerae bacterium]|nr:ABC transporter permease [Phycisphaerae bacterium]